MTNQLTIKEAANLLGVSTKTIRRWEQEGKIMATRTAGGHRRFKAADLLGGQTDESLTIGYARSSYNQSREHLTRRITVLRTYCNDRNWNYQILQDIGNGVIYNNKGLIRLIKLICSQRVKRLVLTHKDNLLCLGAELVFAICEIFGVEVIILNRSEDVDEEEEIIENIQEIIAVFNARLYGARNQNNQELIEQLQEVARRLE